MKTWTKRGAGLLARHWPLALVFVYLIYVIAPSLWSGLAIIDDHELPAFLGSDHRMSFGEVLSQIRRHPAGIYRRFMPLFFAGRMTEMALWGDHVVFWHVARLVLALISAAGLYVALGTFLPPIAAAVATGAFFSGLQDQIWVKLASSETYAVPLVMIGLAWIALSLKSGRWRPVQLLPGLALILISGLSKESFVPLLPAALVFIYLVLPIAVPGLLPGPPRFSPGDWLALAALAAGTIVIAGGTLWVLHVYGHPQSGRLTTTTLQNTATLMFLRAIWDTFWPIPVALAIIISFVSPKRPLGNMAILLTAILVLLLLPQIVLYGTVRGLMPRYLIPGNLFAVGFLAIAFHFILAAARDNRASGWTVGTVLALALLATAFATLHNADDTRDWSKRFAKSTEDFRQSLGQIIDAKRQHPDWPIVFHAADPNEFEPVISVQRYLAISPIVNDKPYLALPDYTPYHLGGFIADLARQLQQMSEGTEGFAPISQLSIADGRCIAVVFKGASPGGCRIAITVMGERL